MKKFVMLVEEELQFTTISTSSRLPVSPRGGIYFSGNSLNPSDENESIDSFSGTTSRKRAVELLLDDNNKIVVQTGEHKNADTDATVYKQNSGISTTTFQSLEQRYLALLQQSKFVISGKVTITIDLRADSFVASQTVIIQIKDRSDFDSVLSNIRLKKPATQDDAEPDNIVDLERSCSALKI